MARNFTTTEAAVELSAADWQIRRCCDGLETAGVELPRAGRYRLIPAGLLPRLRRELERRGWLKNKEVAQ